LIDDVKVGQYVRTVAQGIRRVDKINENASINRYSYTTGESDWDGKYYSIIRTLDVLAKSNNPLALVEAGDFVNGLKVSAIQPNHADKGEYIIDYVGGSKSIGLDTLDDILTYQQYELNKTKFKEI